MAISRRRSAPVVPRVDYDSDDEQIEYLNYNEPKYYGWTEEFPAPVQVRRPNRKSPMGKLHVAVWENDPHLVQHLILYKGKLFWRPRRT